MFYQLGEIVFVNAFTPLSMETMRGGVYAEHELINMKPRLQKTGNRLNEWNIEIRLHADFCDPGESSSTLERYVSAGEAVKLIKGDGVVDGEYIIVELTKRIEDALPDGTIRSYIVSLQLREYYVYDRLAAAEAEQRNKARANSRTSLPTTTENAVRIPSRNDVMEKNLSDMASNAKSIDAKLLTASDLTVKDKRNLLSFAKNFADSSREYINNFKSLKDSLMNKVDETIYGVHSVAKEVFDQYNEVQNIVNGGVQIANRIGTAIDQPATYLRGINVELQSNMNILERVVQPIKVSKILRGDFI